jgi:hypothetical protein
MTGKHPKVLIASAQFLVDADRVLLGNHPNVKWCDGSPPLRSVWNELASDVQTGADWCLWALAHQASTEQLAVEDALRQQLNALGRPYRTLHAKGFTEALELALWRQPPNPLQTALAQQQWQSWLQRGCEKCSDPVCEHRLFQDLLQQRPEVVPKGSITAADRTPVVVGRP